MSDIRLGDWSRRCRLAVVALSVVTLLNVAAVPGSWAVEATLTARPIAESRFGPVVPEGWQMGEGWTLTPAGARAAESCDATWALDLPEHCLVEMIIELPVQGAPWDDISASLTVAPENDTEGGVTARAQYSLSEYSATLSGVGPDGKRIRTSAQGEKRGWAEKTVSLGMMIGNGWCRILGTGRRKSEIECAPLEQRRVSLTCRGVVLKAVRVLPGVARNYVPLGGWDLSMWNKSISHEPVEGMAVAPAHSAVLELGGVPFVIQGSWKIKARLSAMNVGADSRAHRVGLPVKSYSAVHLLLHAGAEGERVTPGLGTGLQLDQENGGDLRNVYTGEVPVRTSDQGVTVRPVSELGEGWFVARVPVNPQAMYGRLGVQYLYLARPWRNGSRPEPDGRDSALRVAAVTVEEAGIDLAVEGNGFGNVYAEPDVPHLSATIRNVTAAPVKVEVKVELIPFERKATARNEIIELAPGEEKTVDALAAPVVERSHYKVRVVADAGAAGRLEHRTNVALLAPDTRKKENSPFGIWWRLSGDNSTPEQQAYLREKLGIGYVHDRHTYAHRIRNKIPDDATAEEIVRKMGPEVRVAMFAWERKWEDKGGYDVTYQFPRVISEGKAEELSDEVNANVDEVAEELRRFSKALRKLRPEIKISLGNTGVNWVTFLLEHGIKHGEHFDYFGTEEGMFSLTPEQPADAVGNISWWARAICRHYGFQNVPLFHSEAIYYPSGIGFSRISERNQAGYYIRSYLLGFPYDSIYGMTGALVDSSEGYIYRLWGSSAYCSRAPECSPKLSYAAYAAMTQQLDGMAYDGKLDTGTASLYALRFRHGDGTPLCVLWNLHGERFATAKLSATAAVEVSDVLNRHVEITAAGDSLQLRLSGLPTYMRGVEVKAVEPGPNVAMDLPPRTLLSPLVRDDWTVASEPDEEFAAPKIWRGVPRPMGNFEVSAVVDADSPPGTEAGPAIRVRQLPLPGKHGLLPRHVSLGINPGKEIPIPAGTTRLGIWVRGNSTWARVHLGAMGPGDDQILRACDKGDNFDGWRFLQTGWLKPEVRDGSFKIDRIMIEMPEQQVYVDDLVTTPEPEILISGVYALATKPPAINYLAW